MDFRPLDQMHESDRSCVEHPYHPFYNLLSFRPVVIKQHNEYDRVVFTERPYLGPLLFDNNASDARDHAANERTFLSWLRLSIYMAIVSTAIVLSFHLRQEPSHVEKSYALPFGIIFWFLSLACLVSGLANYIKTVASYSRRAALVQSGWKTQALSTVVATAIIAACVLFLATGAQSQTISKR